MSWGRGPPFSGSWRASQKPPPPWRSWEAGFSDRIGRRKILVVWGYGGASVARPFLALAAAPWHVLVVRFADRLGKGVRSAPRDALLVDSVPQDLTGTAFGLHRAADHGGSVLGPLLAAGILLLAPGDLRLVFALTAVPALLTVALVWRRVREVKPGQAGDGGRPDASAGAAGASSPAPSPSTPPAPAPTSLRELGPTFPRYLAVLLLFTLGNASDAFLLLRAESLGVPAAALPLLWGAFHVSKMIWNVPGGMLSDRVRPQRLILGGWLFYALVYGGFALASTAWQVWALFGVYGLFYGLTESPEKALVAELAPSGLRARAFGAYHFAVGLGALPASLLFGVLWQWRGPSAAFAAGAGFAILSTMLLPFALRGLADNRQRR